MDFEDQCRLVSEAGAVEAAWYLEQYPDVAMLGMDPTVHYLRYGSRMWRRPNSWFDTEFYVSTYRDAHEDGLNPLVRHLLETGERRRPISEAELRQSIETAREQADRAWNVAAIANPRTKRPKISYCIPLMGRLDDIKGTLGFNLEAHRTVAGEVEFLVALFGDERETRAWIEAEFPDALATGLLRVFSGAGLDTWHFGKAKSAFRPHMLGEIYSSLDGDNFVTLDETMLLLEADLEHQGHFLMHHFSGEWGDGTSGRVSMPAWAYRTGGYDPRLLPRQFDEIDAMIDVLKRFPAMPLLCLDADRNMLTRSNFAREMMRNEGLANPIRTVRAHERRRPLNPRGSDYAERSGFLSAMGHFNAHFSGFNHSTSPENRRYHLAELTAARQALIDALPPGDGVDICFEVKDRPLVPPAPPGTVSLFVCARNEEAFLPRLLEHYRSLGVSRFFIVDDHSDRPVASWLAAPDLHVFRPKVGTFRTAKTLWIEALIAAYVGEGEWLLTVDADEFIDLPEGVPSFPALARRLEADGRGLAAGLLLDLFPAPDRPLEDFGRADAAFEQLFTHCFDVDEPTPAEYADHHSVAWAFGTSAPLSWRVDGRYHAFGTIDSLRKVPFLRHRAGQHLNQGFHTLHYTDGTEPPGAEIWQSGTVLTIRHYKLAQLFSDEARQRMLAQAVNYHERTHENICRIFGVGGAAAIEAVQRLAERMRPVETVIRRIGAETGRAAVAADLVVEADEPAEPEMESPPLPGAMELPVSSALAQPNRPMRAVVVRDALVGLLALSWAM